VRIFALALAASAALAAQPTKRPTDADRGKDLYTHDCVQCHGATAHGDGAASRSLVHPPPDLQGKVEADDASIQLVLRGKATMPSFDQSFGPDDARRVLQWMAALSDAAPPAPAAPAPPAGPEAPEPPPTEGGGGEP
jgi:mono/diheme cytochrome c family protein